MQLTLFNCPRQPLPHAHHQPTPSSATLENKLSPLPKGISIAHEKSQTPGLALNPRPDVTSPHTSPSGTSCISNHHTWNKAR